MVFSSEDMPCARTIAARLATFAALVIVAAMAWSQADPSHAQTHSWRLQPRVQREIQNDINQLDAQISLAARRHIISRVDADALRIESGRIRRTFERSSRDGLDRREVADLEKQVNRVRTRLKLQRRQWDDRR